MDLYLILSILLAVSGICLLATLYATRIFHNPLPALAENKDPYPAMSILKPAIGAGSEFLAMLRSHANQQYTNFEILVCCEMGNEDVQHAVQELQNAFPQLQIVLVECPNASEGSNGKVEVLEILASHARNPVLVISDADIQVPENYLEQISQDLAEPKSGLVTSLFQLSLGTPWHPGSKPFGSRPSIVGRSCSLVGCRV